jgi:hypothetical protein
MSFIQKSDAVVINTKLTNIGRQLLASGSLTFKKIEFGDSEVDYDFLRDFENTIDGMDLSIMRPKDANPNIKYSIPISETSTAITKSDINAPGIDIRLITNTAKQRGFFTGSTTNGFTALTSSTYIQNMFTIEISAVTGGTILTVPSVTNISPGTMLLIDWRNPKLTTFTSTTGAIGEAYPRQFLWYKVQTVAGSDVTVDRNLPNFNSAPTTNKSLVYVYPPNNAIDNYYSTGTTVGYWNYNTLSFDSTCNIGANDDVPVWNLNIVYKDTPAGVTNDYTAQYYDGAVFSGFKQYIQGNTDNSTKSQFAIIHFTNKSISNYYGEGFNGNSFRITLPTIMYHGKTDATMGIVLSASTTKKVLPTTLTGFTTEYYDLFESTNPLNIVGKVFNDLRIAVIEDEELVNALALKSDRSHTLPLPEWSIKNESSDSNSLLSKATSIPTQSIALTYLFKGTEAISNGYNTARSYGLNGGIHCGYIQKYNQSTTSAQNFRFNFREEDLKFMQSDINTADGTGFNANKFYILAQKYTFGSEPDPANWVLIDYTSGLTDYNLSWGLGNGTIPVYALTETIYNLNNSHYTAGTPYDITQFIGTIPTPINYTSTFQLGFGEESILLGNINTDIKATVYKTKFSQTLGFNQYNSSNNPTWTDDDDVYVTEAAIYDQNDFLVAVGKLNNPVKKNTNKLFTVELDMDF